MSTKRIVAALSLALVGLSGAAADRDLDERPTAWPQFAVDAELQRILDKIRAGDVFTGPDMELRKDERYALTPAELEPYGGVRPFKQHFLQQLEYTGPGRAIAEPQELTSVKLGFIGPIMSTVSVATGGKSHEEALGIQMLRGARLAIEEANDRGGYMARGIPFELVVSNDNGLWGASGNEIVKQAYQDGVWAILGTIDGANSHIAIRVALKAEVLMINSGDTDPTFIETNIPWVVRVIGDDRKMGYLLVDYLYRKRDFRRVGIIRASNRYGRFGVRELRDGSRRLGKPIALEMAYELGTEDFSLQLERLRQAEVDAIVHWGDARDSARILNQMRASGMRQPYFANDRSVSDEFVELAGANAEGVICGYAWNPDREDAKLDTFRANFRRRFGVHPDTYAAHAYDGMNMLVWAIQAVGLNRAKIRDVFAYWNRPWPGVTGQIPLSAALDDDGQVFLARFERGRWHYLSREDLELPERSARSSEPFFDARRQEARYAGPGREDPEPVDASEVRIAYFGPGSSTDPTWGAAWVAADLAVEKANREGGYRGSPFRLIPTWSENPWGTGVARLARAVYKEGTWAVLVPTDGAAAHLAAQVVAKARLTLINSGSTDKTVNLANVAWAFSCLPQDDSLLGALVRAAGERAGGREPLTLLSTTDHDSRRAASELTRLLTDEGIAVRHHLLLEPDAGAIDATVGRAASLASGAVVVLANARDSARLVRGLRERREDLVILGGPSMGRRIFVDVAGASADGVRFPSTCNPSLADAEFAPEFVARTGGPPDCAAAQTYDAAQLLIEAVRAAGLNRARIRDAVRGLSGRSGAAGVVEWNPVGQNVRPATLATIHEGQILRAGP